jgi:hypothetical protein
VIKVQAVRKRVNKAKNVLGIFSRWAPWLEPLGRNAWLE